MTARKSALLVALCLGSSVWAEGATDIYSAKCKGCHGVDGKAQTKIGQKEKISDFTNPEWQKNHSDEAIYNVIANGSKDNSKMKAYADKLSVEEIKGLVQHIRGFKKTE